MDSADRASAMEWKKKYLQLEGKMRNFRLRAITVRSKLAIKIAEMDLKLKHAEEKAEQAENQMNLFRAAIDNSVSPSELESDILRKKVLELEERCMEQSEQIILLEKKLEYEMYMRSFEKQSLQDKALKIKDWIRSVLRKTENEKSDLHEANARLNVAVETMQARLADVVQSRTQPERSERDAVHVIGEETELPRGEKKQLRRNDKNCLDSIDFTTVSASHPNPEDSRTPYYNDPGDQGFLIGKANVYEVIDDNSVKSQVNKQPYDSSMVDETAVDSFELAAKRGEHEIATRNLSHTRGTSSPPPGFSSSKSDSDNSNSGIPYYSFMGKFDSIRKKLRGLTDHQQKTKDPEEATSSLRGRQKRAKTKTKFQERGRSMSKSKKTPRKNEASCLKSIETTQENFHARSEVEAVQLSTSLPAPKWACKDLKHGLPPTPPLHRMTSVEFKINELAENGFSISNSSPRRSSKANPPIPDCAVGKYEEVVYKKCPFALPVFSRVDDEPCVQIRPTPFSDTSDCSEEENDSSPSLSSYRPSPRPHQRVASNTNDTQGLFHAKRNGSPAIGRAIKRGNSQHSIASSESDYAIPPDAQGPSEVFEPEHKLFKTSKHSSMPCATRSSAPACRLADSMSGKCGYLYKMKSRTRTWSKRWFVLKNGIFAYYRSPNDITKKAQREIRFCSQTAALSRDNSNSPAFRVTCDKQTYYLMAQTCHLATEWINALQADGARSCSGWVMRMVDGGTRRLWINLSNDNKLEFYENDKIQKPFESINLNNCTVEETQLNLHSSTTGGHSHNESPPRFEHLLVVRCLNTSIRDMYLSFETHKLKLSWLRTLTSAGSNSLPVSRDLHESVTEFEKLAMKVLQSGVETKFDGGGDAVWKHPLLSHSKHSLAHPLTSLSSDALRTEAMKLAKWIQRFANEALSVDAADYHANLARCIAQSCLTHEELRGELYSQLIKETNRKWPEKQANPGKNTLVQLWKLLSLLIPIFLPQNDILNFLRKHLKRNEDARTTVGQHAIYCLRSLERATTMGGRETPPSRTESKFVLFQNPYQHSQPLSVPVHFCDGSYEVISFDNSTSVEEFSMQVTVQSALRGHNKSGYALYVNNPDVSNPIEHCVDVSVKICDVISMWETVVRHDTVIYKTIGGTQEGAAEPGKSPRFTFKRRLHAKRLMAKDNAKESCLQVHQIAKAMSRDMIPVSRDLAVEMTSYVAHLDFGSRSKCAGFNLNELVSRYYPARYQRKHFLRSIRERVATRWEALEGIQSSECSRVFLSAARKSPLCFSKLFQAKISDDNGKEGEAVWLSVGEKSLSICNYLSLEVKKTLKYSQLVTFGGCRDQLLLVTRFSGSSKKWLFHMNKVEMLELILTVSDYINLTADQQCHSI